MSVFFLKSVYSAAGSKPSFSRSKSSSDEGTASSILKIGPASSDWYLFISLSSSEKSYPMQWRHVNLSEQQPKCSIYCILTPPHLGKIMGFRNIQGSFCQSSIEEHLCSIHSIGGQNGYNRCE